MLMWSKYVALCVDDGSFWRHSPDRDDVTLSWVYQGCLWEGGHGSRWVSQRCPWQGGHGYVESLKDALVRGRLWEGECGLHVGSLKDDPQWAREDDVVTRLAPKTLSGSPWGQSRAVVAWKVDGVGEITFPIVKWSLSCH